MTFRTFVRTMVQHWKLVVGALLACVAGAGALTALQTKHYQASATIMMSFSGVTSLNDVYNATESSQRLLSSYAAVASGSTVAQRAVDQLHIPMSADALAGQTHATYTPDSMLFTITVNDADPQRAADLAGAMADQFTAIVPTLGMDPGARPAQDADTSQPSSTPSAPTPWQPAPGQPPLPVAKATVVERPGVPAEPISPAPTRNMVLGVIGGLLLGIAMALSRDAVDRTVRTREQLEELAVLPTLAELPARRGSAPRFGTENAFDDAVRGLRNRLLRAMGPDGHRVLVAAPFGGEGSTTTALNLALSFIELDEKVLLIEGDIRRPKIAGLLGVKSGLGLASALTDCPVPGEAVHGTSVKNLFVLASRTARADETLPRSADLPNVLEDLSTHFNRLVIDGPPVLATADTGLLADAVEATVLVVRAGRTTIDEVQDALHALRSTGTAVVGTVLTDAKVSRHTKAAIRTYWRQPTGAKRIGVS